MRAVTEEAVRDRTPTRSDGQAPGCAVRTWMGGWDLWILVVSMAVTACAGARGASDPQDAGCPHDLPAACPSSIPSYTTDIASVITSKCFPCHTTGGIESAKHDFTTYAQVYAQRSPILNQIYACKMPPAGSTLLTADERKLLLSWFVCNAPDN